MQYGWFPSPYPVVHYSRRFSQTQTDPDTGNEVIIEAAPVIRYAQEISQAGRSSSEDVLSGEFDGRTVETMIMSVADPESYSSQDRVIIDPVIEDNEYVLNTGTAYSISGEPNDQRNGPWASWFKGFGGVVQLKRVT